MPKTEGLETQRQTGPVHQGRDPNHQSNWEKLKSQKEVNRSHHTESRREGSRKGHMLLAWGEKTNS